jgi:hypothetical protein
MRFTGWWIGPADPALHPAGLAREQQIERGMNIGRPAVARMAPKGAGWARPATASCVCRTFCRTDRDGGVMGQGDSFDSSTVSVGREAGPATSVRRLR